MRILVIILGLLASPLLAGGKAQPVEKAKRGLGRAYPRVVWSGEAAIADFDCDGRKDYAFLGKRGQRVYVGFQLSKKLAIQVLQFGIGPDQQNSICEEPAEIAVEDLDFDPSGAVEVEGLQLSGSCKGLQLIGGECDFFHIYWNHAAKRLDWWRL